MDPYFKVNYFTLFRFWKILILLFIFMCVSSISLISTSRERLWPCVHGKGAINTGSPSRRHWEGNSFSRHSAPFWSELRRLILILFHNESVWG